MNNANPLVSVVIPTYNQNHQFLKECIESAINQTHKNIEILISDNHSTNGASEMIAQFAQNEKRIRIIKPPQFLPLMMDHFKFAYSNVSGEFICPLSSDDMLFPDFIKTHIAPFFVYPSLSFVYSLTAAYQNDFKGNPIFTARKREERFYSSKEAIRNFLDMGEGSFGGILLSKKKFILARGFQNDLLVTGDAALMISMVKVGDVYFIDKSLSGIRIWYRNELSTRLESEVKDVNFIYTSIENDKLLMSWLDNDKKLISTHRDSHLKPICFTMAYKFFKFKENRPMLERTAVLLKEIYKNDCLQQIVLNNRKNIIGFLFSIIYLSIRKFRIIF